MINHVLITREDGANRLIVNGVDLSTVANGVRLVIDGSDRPVLSVLIPVDHLTVETEADVEEVQSC